jgi:hypothetical protein
MTDPWPVENQHHGTLPVLAMYKAAMTASTAFSTRSRFSPSRDTIFLLGDLVNRGPDSLGVLRRLMALDGNSARCLLGNHDLHLLAVAARRAQAQAKATPSATSSTRHGRERTAGLGAPASDMAML